MKNFADLKTYLLRSGGAALELAKEAGKDFVLSIIPQGTKAQALLDMYPFNFDTISV